MRKLSFAALVAAVVLCAPAHAQEQEQEIVFGNVGAGVTDSDIEFYLRDRVPVRQRVEYLQGKDATKDLAENLFIIRTLAAEAEAAGVVDKELIEWQVQTQRQRLMMEQYIQALQRQRSEATDWEATAKEVYIAEPEKFMRPESVRASHILVKTGERSDEEALALAERILGELNSGTDFEVLAERYSEDEGSKQRGGSLGAFSRGRMVEPFEEAVFALRKPGEVTGPVKTQFGYHIIRLDEYLPAGKRSFDEVKGQIIAEQQKEQAKKVRVDKIIETRSQPDIKVDRDKLEQLREQMLRAATE